MEYNLERISEIKEKIIPELFLNERKINEYGDLEQIDSSIPSSSVNSIDMKNSIVDLLSSVEKANPDNVIKSNTVFNRVSGKHDMVLLEYNHAKESIPGKIVNGKGIIEEVSSTLDKIQERLNSIIHYQNELKHYVAAGQEYLEENPEAGIKILPGQPIDNSSRRRFGDRLNNLMLINNMNAVTIEQLKISLETSLNIVDMFNKVHSVIYPVWFNEITRFSLNNLMGTKTLDNGIKRIHNNFVKEINNVKDTIAG